MNKLIQALAGLSLATGLVAAQAQQVLLAVDTQANRILQLSPQTGAVLNGSFIVDANSAATYDFQTLRAAVQVGSQIWVSDQSPNINAIYRFDLGGAYLGKIGGNVAGGGLSNVRGMRVIGDTVYVVNQGNTNGAPGPALIRFDFNGNNLGSFATSALAGTVGLSPWDVAPYNGRLLVSDGTSRGLQQYNLDGSYFGAFTSTQINNIPQQMFVRANGNVLMSAQGSQPSGSFGLYELGTDGAVLRQWTNTPGLGVRGVYELGNGQFLISEAGGASALRGLGTIDPNGPASSSNFTLIQGNFSGGWLSVAVIPEPSTWLLMAAGLACVTLLRRRSPR
jgi:PEP-CTERM motif